MAETNPGADVRSMILQAPDPIWKRIQEMLRVETREQAVVLAERDPAVAAKVRSIVSGEGESFITQPGNAAQSLLTSPPRAPVPIEDRLYPGQGKGKPKVEF